MKYLFSIITLLIISNLCYSQSYHIKLKVNGLSDTKAQLAYYYEDKQYIAAEASLNNKGVADFKGDKMLPRGLYMLIIPDKRYFVDLIIADDQVFIINSDTANFAKNIRYVNCTENTVFWKYQSDMSELINEKNKLDSLIQINNSKDSLQDLKKQKKSIELELENKWKAVAKANPNTFLSTMLNAMNATSQPKDKMWEYVNLSDSGLIRTPFFYGIIRTHIARHLERGVDRINYENDKLIALSKANHEVYRYITGYLLNFYRTFTKAGMNKVFVHIAENYFLNADDKWLNAKVKKIIRKQVDIFKASFVGMPATNLKLASSKGDSINLFDIKAKKILLYFWSSGCGHCDNATKRIKENYAKLKELGYEVVGMNTNAKSMNDYNRALNEKPSEWPQYHDLNHKSRFREYYYVASSPLMYVIDNKRIIKNKAFGDKNIENIINAIVKK